MDRHFIDGHFTEAANPSLLDVVRSVQAANKALTAELKKPSLNIVMILETIAVKIEDRAELIANAVLSDLGIPLEISRQYSIPEAAAHFRAHAGLVGLRDVSESVQPVGIVGVITPASDPLVCLASRVAPALAQGNAVIAKVSSQTPRLGEVFAALVHEAGLPAGLLAILTGRGDTIGEAIVQHPGIATLSFQGSLEKGRTVAMLASEGLKKIHLSLGAKNPVLLFNHTSWREQIPLVAQICLGHQPSQNRRGSRLFIQEAIFKEALSLLRAEFDRAPLAHFAKAEQSRIYQEAVRLAEKENGKVVTGTSSELRPFLFADLTNCSTLQQEDIAGPIVLAGSFKYAHEALKHANVSPFGRIGYIFESDLEKARKVADKMEVGSVFVNRAALFDPLEEIPLLKSSGNLTEGGRELAKFFSRKSKAHYN